MNKSGIIKKIKSAVGKSVSTRSVSLSKKQLTTSIDHNLRLTNKGCEKVDKPTQTNLAFENGKFIKFKQKEDYGRAIKKEILGNYDGIREQHKNLWNDNHKRANNFKNDKKSYAEQIVWFGGKDEGTELQKDSLLAKKIEKHGLAKTMKVMLPMARDHFEKMAKEFNIELIGPTVVHLDELGQPHFHQLTTNFDLNDGTSPNFRQNKKGAGAKLQDMVAAAFEKLGFKRGISAAERLLVGESVRHQPNREYQASQAEQQINHEARQVLSTELANEIKAQTAILRKLKSSTKKMTKWAELQDNWHKKKVTELENTVIPTLTAKVETQANIIDQLRSQISDMESSHETEQQQAEQKFGRWGFQEAEKLFKPKLEHQTQVNRVQSIQLNETLEINDKLITINNKYRLDEQKRLNPEKPIINSDGGTINIDFKPK